MKDIGPEWHDYERDLSVTARTHAMETDPPCQICGMAKGYFLHEMGAN